MDTRGGGRYNNRFLIRFVQQLLLVIEGEDDQTPHPLPVLP